MVIIQEMDLFDLGEVCGVVGTLELSTKSQLVQALDDSHCNCILFCYRGLQDDDMIRAIFEYVQTNSHFQLVLVCNEEEMKNHMLKVQAALDKIIGRVDMVLPSTWPIEDLPIFIGIHSDVTIWANALQEKRALSKVKRMCCCRNIEI